jgi:alpha-beta hydrolase superfamily lysophospholipase
MIHSEFRFEGAGGLQLFGQSWQPETDLKAVLCIVHGIGEHSGRYQNVVKGVLPKGISVAAFDLRGHGRSSGPRGHVKSWTEYLADLDSFLGIVRARHPDLPVFLFGHSLGSLIVAEYALEKDGGLAGVVLSSLAVEPVGAAKPVLVAIARLLSGVCPAFPIPLKLETKALSGDRNVVHCYEMDPLVHGIGTARWGTEALDAVERLKSVRAQFVLPVLVLHGGAKESMQSKGHANSLEGRRLGEVSSMSM